MPRQKVEVYVVGGLLGSEAHIEADGEVFGGHAVLEARMSAVHQEPARLLLALCEIEVVRYMPLREDERVTLRDDATRQAMVPGRCACTSYHAR